MRQEAEKMKEKIHSSIGLGYPKNQQIAETIHSMNDSLSNSERALKDKCVLCGKETEYTKDIHIDQRDYYVEGAGQLCLGCYIKVYGKG